MDFMQDEAVQRSRRVSRKEIRMNFIDIAKKRYSVRKYAAKQIEKEALDQILEAGRIAPSACNLQPYCVLVLQTEESLKKLSRAANVFFAPTVLVICADTTEVWTRKFDGKKTTDIDASIATDHMMLQATELGVGSLWVCKFEPDVLSQSFHLPPHIVPINILALGYSLDEAKSPNRHISCRKPIRDLVYYEEYKGIDKKSNI